MPENGAERTTGRVAWSGIEGALVAMLPLRPRSISWVRAGLLIGAYFVAGKLGLMVAFLHVSASPVWPPTGMALAALLLFGIRFWPAIFVGAFLVNLTTAGSVATSLGIATGNTLEGVLGAVLVTRFANGRNAFDDARDIFKFAVLAGTAQHDGERHPGRGQPRPRRLRALGELRGHLADVVARRRRGSHRCRARPDPLGHEPAAEDGSRARD